MNLNRIIIAGAAMIAAVLVLTACNSSFQSETTVFGLEITGVGVGRVLQLVLALHELLELGIA